MDYCNDILNRLVDIYERRSGFNKDNTSMRAIQIEVKKVYPSYVDRYNHNEYVKINASIEVLSAEGLVVADRNTSGQYSKIRLNTSMIDETYNRLKRITIPEQCIEVKQVLNRYEGVEHPMIQIIISDWNERISGYKKLPYDLKFDSKRIAEVIRVLIAITELDQETYIRNFSTALFKDSKMFQREYRNVVEAILFDYTEEVLEKNKILEFYNLYENPTYVLIKGNAVIHFTTSLIDVSEMPDGIALSNASLDRIKSITVNSEKIVSVENLTTYHDSDDTDAVYIYLGGYHNRAKQMLLEKVYSDNADKTYFHKGDLDVYGFLILENLREKTGIPFTPLMMDVRTLNRLYSAGIYKELTATDIKVIMEKKDDRLSSYADVLQFMLDNNCKVEQESIKASELMK